MGKIFNSVFNERNTYVISVENKDGTMSFAPVQYLTRDRTMLDNPAQFSKTGKITDTHNLLTGSIDSLDEYHQAVQNIKDQGEGVYKGKKIVDISICPMENFLAQREYLQIDGANFKDKLLLKKYEMDLLKTESKIEKKQTRDLIYFTYRDLQEIFAVVNKQEKVRNEILARQNNNEQKKGKHAPQEDVITVGLEEPEKASENTVEKESTTDRRLNDPLYYHDLKADLDSTDKKTSKKPTLDGGMSL